MGKIVYSVIGSLDGFIDDAEGRYDWATPGEDLVAAINDELAGVGTYVYGRRMYEQMHVWETDPEAPTWSPQSARFAEIWQRAEKVVFSRTLPAVQTTRTRLEREFTPEALRAITAAATGDVTVEGPTLAAHALRAGLVDEIHRYVVPVIVGGGTALYPAGLRLDLELTGERRFDGGIIALRYRVR